MIFGTITFVGELYHAKLLRSTIIYQILRELLQCNLDAITKDDMTDIEASIVLLQR
jgi:hypothetical protein